MTESTPYVTSPQRRVLYMGYNILIQSSTTPKAEAPINGGAFIRARNQNCGVYELVESVVPRTALERPILPVVTNFRPFIIFIYVICHAHFFFFFCHNSNRQLRCCTRRFNMKNETSNLDSSNGTTQFLSTVRYLQLHSYLTWCE